jgi:glycosyltransferase involved in cell wall biosynthesis
MRIVQILPELNEGGVERGTVELNREFVIKGHESIVISAGGKLDRQIESDGGQHITFDVCSKNPLNVPWRVFKLRTILKRLKPNIIHVRSRVPAWLAYLANKSLKIPFVTTVHGFNSVSPYSKIMSMGDHVICVSNSIKDYIIKHYGTDEKKITVIPRGVDLKHFNPSSLDTDFIKTFKSQYGLDGKTVISSVGRVTQLKDYETFIEAIALLKNEIPDVLGVIVGGVREDKQRYAQSLQKLSVTLGIEDSIVFTGSQKQIAEIYSLSDVIVSASKKPESFGRSVAEALAMGTPVVASNHGGVKDIVVDGENGTFFETGNAEALCQCILQVRPYRFDGYEYINKNFSLEKMLEKTLEVYNRLVK